MVKLNVFHWHMTDSQSFPLVLKKHPDLVRLGAYSPEKVYTIQDIIDVTIRELNFRSIRLLFLLMHVNRFIIMHTIAA